VASNLKDGRKHFIVFIWLKAWFQNWLYIYLYLNFCCFYITTNLTKCGFKNCSFEFFRIRYYTFRILPRLWKHDECVIYLNLVTSAWIRSIIWPHFINLTLSKIPQIPFLLWWMNTTLDWSWLWKHNYYRKKFKHVQLQCDLITTIRYHNG